MKTEGKCDHCNTFGDWEVGIYYDRGKIIDGWVITDTNHKHIKTVYPYGVNSKQINVVDEAKKYISY